MTVAPAYSPDLSGIVALLVDDNADSLDILSLALERFGATLQTAANARDALAKASRSRPDAIVSDLSMPDEDGLWLVDQLKRRHEGDAIAAVALTAHRSRYNVFQSADVGCDAFVAKPVDPFYLGEYREARGALSRRNHGSRRARARAGTRVALEHPVFSTSCSCHRGDHVGTWLPAIRSGTPSWSSP